MPIELNPTVVAFLTRFFGSGNLLQWSSIQPRVIAGTHDLAPWIERLARSEPAPTLLPRAMSDATVWYGLGHSHAQSDQLREELFAFVGPTYSDFLGHRTQLDPADPVELSVQEFTGGYAFRLRVPVKHRDVVRASLERLRQLWDARPRGTGVAIRSVGRVLREFELALSVRDLSEARARLDELASSGMLDARNVLFQEIRLLATGERWADIMSLEALPDLAQIRCPIIVADAVLQAIYATQFAALERDAGPAAALAHFREYALGRWSSFFRVKSTIRSASALKLFMMLAVSATPPRFELRDSVLAEPSLTGPDRAYCEALAGLAPPEVTTQESPLELARARFDLGDYEGAFPAALAAQPSLEQLRLLLNCAVEISRLDCAATVLKVVEDAPAPIRDSLLASGRSRVLWEHLVESTRPANSNEPPPSNFGEWLDRLMRPEPWPTALQVAEQGAREWDVAAFLRDGVAVEHFRSQLTNRGGRSPAAQVVLRDAMPYLIDFLLHDDGLLRRARGVLEDVLLILTDEDDVGAADLGAIKEVVSALIDVGPSASEYRELVAFLVSVWERFGAPRRLEWALDAFEILTLLPAPATEARDGFATRVIASFAKWRNQVDVTQWRLLRMLCTAVSLGESFAALAPADIEDAPQAELAEALDGRTVGIYSLMERPAQHARDVLLSTCPGVEVVVNSDHVATTQLRELSKRADVFVMVWRAAKHAATACIEASRPKHAPLLRPDGRSATSILRSITTWGEQQSRDD